MTKRLWKLRPFAALLAFDLVCGVLVAWRVPFQVPNVERLCAALQFTQQHRIADDFLPIGYSGLLGVSNLVGGETGMTVLSILLSVGVIVAAWYYLRTLGLPTTQIFVLTLLLSVYPDFLLSYNKAMDTAPTAIVLFAFVAVLIRVVDQRRFGAFDLMLALILGYALLSRPNLALLIPVVWLCFWRFRVPHAVWRSAGQLVILTIVYLAGTTAIHGRPFFPQNGPYNLYAGANPYTEQFITNEEDSLPSALRDQGIATSGYQDCGDTIALAPTTRDPSLKAIYMASALRFMRAHPRTVLRLTWLKFKIMMYPDLRIYRLQSLGGAMKMLAALAFPLWVAAFVLPHPGPRTVRFILVLTVVAYIVPFLCTISSARFRVPLDYLWWIDLGAVIAYRLTGSAGGSQGPA